MNALKPRYSSFADVKTREEKEMIDWIFSFSYARYFHKSTRICLFCTITSLVFYILVNQFRKSSSSFSSCRLELAELALSTYFPCHLHNNDQSISVRFSSAFAFFSINLSLFSSSHFFLLFFSTKQHKKKKTFRLLQIYIFFGVVVVLWLLLLLCFDAIMLFGFGSFTLSWVILART